jgi:hypothetical protein
MQTIIHVFDLIQKATQWLRQSVTGFPLGWPRFDHVRFVVAKIALRLVFSEYFGFPCQPPTAPHIIIIIIYHLGLVQ